MSEEELTTLCFIYKEMNSIRVRDGAPESVCEKYWDKLCEQLDDIVLSRTGKQAWLNPLMYKPKEQASE